MFKYYLCFGWLKQKWYWKGRGAGWRACEDSILSHAKAAGYDVNKLMEDLLQ